MMQAAAVGSSQPTSASDPADLGLLDAVRLQRTGGLSAVELTEACLRRIEERNGGAPRHDGDPNAVNAWVRLYPDLAREHAERADQRRHRDPDDAPLVCGVPLGLKDLFAIAGLPLTASSRVLGGNVASSDSVVWARLRDQGMVPLGHTHSHEFAAGGTTDQVGNPWRLDLIAGGSSGGNAAAVAARMVSAALGTDTCGSLRIPSACCGTSAIKPTHGRVPIEGIIALAPSLDHAGPMARTVADCSALLGAMAAGAAQVTPLTPPPAPLGPLPLEPRPAGKPLQGVTIALTERPNATPIAGEIGDALDEARRACESLGARILELRSPWIFDWDDLSRVLLTEVWWHHAEFADRLHEYRPAVAEFVEAARGFTDAQAYLAAQARRAEGTAAWEEWFRVHRVDLVLEPTLPIPPYERGPGYERGHAGGPGDPLIALTAMWDMTGLPVAALPVNWWAGVSLVAPRGHEAPLIQAAIDLQEHALGIPVDPLAHTDSRPRARAAT